MWIIYGLQNDIITRLQISPDCKILSPEWMRMWIVAKWIRIEWMWVEKKDKISRYGKMVIIRYQEDLANIIPVRCKDNQDY